MSTQTKDILTPEEWKQVSALTNAIYLQADIQANYINNAELIFKGKAEFKHEVKHYVKEVQKNTRMLVQMVNKFAPQHNDNFAHDSDILKTVINKTLFQ